jgi:hypothetical protein
MAYAHGTKCRPSHPKGQRVSLRNRAGFVCIAIPTLVELGLGIVYFAASEVMPYHKEALGVEWSQVAPGARALLITLVNGYGSAHFAVGIALCALLLFPLRQGHAWARWTILAVGFPVLGATAYLSARLSAMTEANVPWQGAVILLLLLLVGVALVDPRAAAQPVDPPDRLPPVPPPVGGR